jgi:hypothetical protein
MITDDEMERMRKWSWPMSRYCLALPLKDLHKTTKIQDNQNPSQELNWVLPKYRPKILTPEPISSVLATVNILKRNTNSGSSNSSIFFFWGKIYSLSIDFVCVKLVGLKCYGPHHHCFL